MFPTPCDHAPNDRRLCPNCQEAFDEEPEAWEEFGEHPKGRENFRRLQEEIAADQEIPLVRIDDGSIPF